MKALFSASLWKYTVGIFALIMITGTILSSVVDDVVILLCMLLFQAIVLFLMFVFAYDRFIKPLGKVSDTVGELLKGNYRARIYHAFHGEVGELSQKVNALARYLSELSLQEQIQSEQLASVINHTHSGLLFIDERGYIQLVNEEFLDIFGQREQDYLGHLYYDVIAYEDIHKTVQQIFLYEKNVKLPLFVKGQPADRFMEITGAPIFNERNILKGAVLAFYDITSFKKLELMRKDFVANVSHELKTPVTSIKGFSETLLEENVDEQTKQRFLQIIYDESNRLQLLINDLLTLTRLEKETPDVSFERVDLQDTISEIKPGFDLLAKERHLQFEVNISGNVSFVADSNQMKQVVINLLTNAFNYTPKGSVTLRASQSDSKTIIQVADTGIGMEPEAIPRIFERFYRLDEARSRDTGGTGLGLAIVKHIVEIHNGKIEVESAPEAGTTITILLPTSGEPTRETLYSEGNK
ncbi:ATP-binding protein [Virgibacillus sp. 179-BFC.A HS]|uniref:histidine kinase n=1 Tax=Tigheibacillus jepli TaxID=3035914 RepID=A0ABU5CGC6_9BACI|nr:HAMP domain-containing sensor histidine kinase [Virgibacillus sp. 179-BFC.A HS]MDY0405360.1 ATP-binding protein [Virgibacillus sp. 179-BFC.A HS]